MLRNEPNDITGLLIQWRGGSEDALAALMPLVYRRLKEIAGHLVRRERQDHTLETTALVHEAYLRLVDLDGVPWKDRVHFFAMSARIMRRVLVDHARYLLRDKRGGGAQRAPSLVLLQLPSEQAPDLVAIDEALEELAAHDREKAQVVELRFFGGLGRDEIGEALGISSATVTRRWRSARAWLIRYLSRESP